MPEYFLHVDLLVAHKDHRRFETLVGQFLNRGAFQYLDPDISLEIVLALKTQRPFRYQEPADQGARGTTVSSAPDPRLSSVHRYVHLWRLNTKEDLDIAQAMLRSADDRLYSEIDSLVAIERQDLVARVQWKAGQPVMNNAKLFIRMRQRFNSGDVGVYLFKEGILFPGLAKSGYRTLGNYQNVTGTLDTIVEFWEAPNSALLNGLSLGTKGAVTRAKGAALRANRVVRQFVRRIDTEVDAIPASSSRDSFIRAPYARYIKKNP